MPLLSYAGQQSMPAAPQLPGMPGGLPNFGGQAPAMRPQLGQAAPVQPPQAGRPRFTPPATPWNLQASFDPRGLHGAQYDWTRNSDFGGAQFGGIPWWQAAVSGHGGVMPFVQGWGNPGSEPFWRESGFGAGPSPIEGFAQHMANKQVR